jgi:hypothetical protein
VRLNRPCPRVAAAASKLPAGGRDHLDRCAGSDGNARLWSQCHRRHRWPLSHRNRISRVPVVAARSGMMFSARELRNERISQMAASPRACRTLCHGDRRPGSAGRIADRPSGTGTVAPRSTLGAAAIGCSSLGVHPSGSRRRRLVGIDGGRHGMDETHGWCAPQFTATVGRTFWTSRQESEIGKVTWPRDSNPCLSVT